LEIGTKLTGAAGLGYLAAWTGFSLLATLAQWRLVVILYLRDFGVSKDAFMPR